MAAWRLAKSLDQLRRQVNLRAPARSKASDGTLGDAAHASRASDHNPWVRDGTTGVVTALDVTHDPTGGCDAGEIAEALVASRDKRLKYLIYARRIVRSYPKVGLPAWTWSPYTGRNPHTKHVHISVVDDRIRYDDVQEWQLPAASG